MTTTLVPNPLFNYSLLFSLVLPVASLLVGVGLLSAFQRAGSVAEQMRALVQVAAVVALMAYFDTVVQTSKSLVHRLVEEGLHAKPEELPKKFAEKLLASEPKDADGLWSKVTKFATHIFHGLLVALIVFMALAALVLFFLGYVAQELALEVGIGLAPLFVGFLLLPGTRSIGAQFLLYMLAIVLFPVGWGVASLVSDKLIDVATAQNLAQTSDAAATLSFSMRNFFGALLLAIWIILSTFAAPLAMLKAVTTGVHISSEAFRGLRAALRS